MVKKKVEKVLRTESAYEKLAKVCQKIIDDIMGGKI